MQLRRRWPLLLTVVLLTLLGAGPLDPVSEHGRAASRDVRATSGAHDDTSTPFHLVSLPALVEHEYDGHGLRLTRLVAATPAYTRHHVAYRSGGLTVTGALNVPAGPGPHPLLVLAHGYHDPADYRTGDGSQREQARFAAQGYVVLQPDYRNHGGSDRDHRRRVARPLGYPEDVVNAVLAVREAAPSFVDVDRVGLVGRSMGGGVALQAAVARPDLFDVLVLHSPVSSRAADNFRRWVGSGTPLERKVLDTYGAPAENRRFWREASARAYVDRVTAPVQIHHGAADPVCPVAWSRATARALRRAGKDAALHEYPGESHRIDAAWPTMMRRTTAFLDQHLR